MSDRILIIDDEETLCYFLKESLAEKGYEATAVHTASEGLEQVTGQPVDLVLLDLKLPDGDGLDVLQEIRKLDEDLPVIVLTGHAAVDSAVRAMKLGAQDYLEKPINLAQLSASVSEVLSSARRRAPAETASGLEQVADVVPPLTDSVAETRSAEGGATLGDLAESAQRVRDAQAELRRAQSLSAICGDLLKRSRVYEMAESVAEHLVQTRPAEMVAIFVGDSEDPDFVFASQRHCPPGLWDQAELRRIPRAGVLGQALSRWEHPLPLGDAGPDPWVEAVGERLGSGFATALVPLRQESQLLGLMLVGARGRRPYVQSEKGFFGVVGGALASALGRALDITALQDRLNRVAGREDRQRELLQNLPDGLVVVDVDGRVRMVNPAAETLLDCQEAVSLGQGIEALLGPESSTVRDSLSHNLPYSEQEISIARGGGSLSLLMSISPLWGDGGSAEGAAIVLRDLSRLKEFERERRTQERLDILARVSGVVAHEIRNPLAGMAAGIQHLLTKVPEGDDKYQALQRILKEGERVNRVIEDILILTRPVQLGLEPCRVPQLMREVVRRWEDRASRQNVRVREYYASGVPPVRADRDRLSQALSNLLVNGIEAMPDGGLLDVSVTASSKGNGRYVQIDISDRGAGMKSEDLDRVFEPFYTTKPGATGLGITIAQRIINEHGGEVDLDSEEGRGTRATVRLPVAGAQLDE
jgi:two-component system nitrogen regulation sensor histidine kinase GlnL